MSTKFPVKRKTFKIFHWECLILVILGWKFLEKRLLPCLKSARLNLRNFKVSLKKNFMPGTKIILLGCFRVQFQRNYCHIWNQNPWILQIAKFRVKQKNFRFHNKIASFRYFWAAVLKNYFHIWNQHPQIGGIAKFHQKRRKFKLGTKNVLFGYF